MGTRTCIGSYQLLSKENYRVGAMRATEKLEVLRGKHLLGSYEFTTYSLYLIN